MKNKKLEEQIIKITKLMSIKENESELDESGFSRVATTLRGLNPRIKTIVILSGENPCGDEMDSKTNKRTNENLKDDIREGLWGYRQVKGRYGILENPFIVNNMSKGDGMKLGAKYRQQSIIYGERFETDKEYGMVFQLIQTTKCGEKDGEVGGIIGEARVFINRDDFNDNYTEVKGRKFQIPLFDVEDEEKKTTTSYKDATWDGGKVVGQKVSRLYKIEDISPEELEMNVLPEDIKKIDGLLEESLNDNRNWKSRWINRGYIRNILKKYKFD